MSVSQPSDPERDRIIESFIAVVADLGYNETTLDPVLAEAGVDEAVFHRYFADKEECFLVALDFITDYYRPRILTAYESEDCWRERMRAVGLALIEYVTEHPDHARILSVESRMPGERAWVLVDRNIEFFVDLIDVGRQEMEDPEALTRATAQGIAGAVREQLAQLLLRGETSDVKGLLGPLMYMVVRPYLGDEVAEEELQRP